MKRFAAIVTIAVVIFTMSVGTAFASVCAMGETCGGEVMACEMSAPAACPMGGGQVMTHGGCDHSTDGVARDSVSLQPVHEKAAIATSLVVVPTVPVLRGFVAATAAPDARGAPHLTAVIRI